MYGKDRFGTVPGAVATHAPVTRSLPLPSVPRSKTFNTLKNHGYNSEDNYGWVKQNLARILFLWMVLASTLDRMMQLRLLSKGQWR